MGTLQTPVGFQTKAATVTNAAKPVSHADFGFSTAELAAADIAYVTPFSYPIVLTADGVAPTTALGTYVAAADTMIVRGSANIVALQFIRAADDDSTVSVSLFKFI